MPSPVPVPISADTCPLYVDLDGTLTPTDTLYESALLLIRRQPWHLLRLLSWLPEGKVRFKQHLADAVRPDPACLPYNEAFLRFLQIEHQKGRPLILASAADWRIANDVSKHLGIFDDVLGTQTEAGGPNLAGAEKLKAIANHASSKGYSQWCYAGNSRDDLQVWRGCAEAVAVNAPRAVLASLQTQHPHALNFPSKPLSTDVLLRAIRLKQWAKNILLFAPLLAAHSLNAWAWGATALAFLAFGLCASATYLFNDMLDLSSDRLHRHKRNRPLASAAMTIPFAIGLAAAMMLLAFALAWWVSVSFAGMLLLYTVATLAYTLYLKRLPLIDVLILAALYTLRIGAGAMVAQVELSNWLLAISMFLFLSLALVKRCAELEETSDQNEALAPGRGYQSRDLVSLRSMGMASGFMAILVLTLYIDSETGRAHYLQPQLLWLAAPMALLWVMRIWLKTGRREMHGEDPLQFALRDGFTWAIVLIIGAIGILAKHGL